MAPENTHSDFELEMRTALARIEAHQNDLSSTITQYLQKTNAQELASTKIRSELDILFDRYAELHTEIKENKKEISSVIEDKIDSIYKMVSVVAFIISLAVPILLHFVRSCTGGQFLSSPVYASPSALSSCPGRRFYYIIYLGRYALSIIKKEVF